MQIVWVFFVQVIRSTSRDVVVLPLGGEWIFVCCSQRSKVTFEKSKSNISVSVYSFH